MLSRSLVLFCSFVLATSVCRGSERGTPVYGGVLRIGLDGQIGTVNPFKTHFRQLFGYQRLYAEGLVDIDRQGNLVPGVAESWDISPDGLLYTFRIRKGIKFHNGEEMLAEDIKQTLQYMMEPKNAANYRTNLDLVDAVETADRSVKIRIKKALTPFLSNLYAPFVPIVSRKSTATLESQPVGSGPFVIQEYKQGLHLRLRRFRDYWKQGRPYLDEVVFRFVPDESVRFTALRSGDVEIADELPSQRMTELKGSPPKDFRVMSGLLGGDNLLLLLNTRRPPLNDVRVRQAIALALDKQEIVDAVRWGAAEPTNQVYPKKSPWHFDVEDRKRDLATARKLMTEAGLSQGFPLPIMVNVKTMPTAQMVQSQLKTIGVRVEFQQLDTPTRLARLKTWDFASDLRGQGLALDPDNTFRYYYSTIGFRNYSGYNNPEFDRLYDRALVEQDFQKRKQLYTGMMRLLQRDVPEIFLYSAYRYIGLRENVKGFEPDLAGMNTYSDGGLDSTWLDRP